jgi:cell wall-associated NlpC family hydrolase
MRFTIVFIFLIGLLNSSMVFAHEDAKHRPVHSHHHHHTVSKLHHPVQGHSSKKISPHPAHPPSHPSPAVHQLPVHHANAVKSVNARPVVIKTTARESFVRPAGEHLVMVHSEKHRWRHWAAEHHWHNPHLIRRSIVFAAATEQGIVSLIHKAIASLHQTHYRYGGNYFNMSNGIYDLDCSDYVDDLLRISQPRAYADLAGATHTEKPTSNDYYQFFNRLSDDSSRYWQKIDDVESLKPGDILVFRNYGGGGHVMVVMDNPTPALSDDSTYFVRVSDSAASRHSDDTRPSHVSGVGIGTLLLKANPQTGEPSAYAWTVDSGWDRVRVAMAEPVSQA